MCRDGSPKSLSSEGTLPNLVAIFPTVLIPKGRSCKRDCGKPRSRGLFGRKVRVEYQHGGQLQLCPLKWLDNFSMRNFTNASVFDDTLPVADGWMEIGTHVPIDQLRDAMEDWFRRKSYLPRDSNLLLTVS